MVWKTYASRITPEQCLAAALKGKVYALSPANVHELRDPPKFNPAWFPVEPKNTRRPMKGDRVKYHGRNGWILFVDDGSAVVKFPEGDDEHIDLDDFFSYTSRGRTTIWDL